MFNAKRPPCPDPERYVWVASREGGHWRRKRGMVKGAVLNKQYQVSSENTKLSSPAASRIARKLQPYLQGLKTGRLTARLSGKLRMALNRTGNLGFDFLNDFELQPEHPLPALLKVTVSVLQKKDELLVTIPMDVPPLRQHSKLVTNYYFELVLLWGDAGKDDGLRTDTAESRLFAIDKVSKIDCQLKMQLPDAPWMALLKVSCVEGNELAVAARNYGMRVVEVGS